MKPNLPVVFLLLPVVCSLAKEKPPCYTHDCHPKTIRGCPDTGCAHPETKGPNKGKLHPFDKELDKLKNKRSSNQQAVLHSIQWIKDRRVPKSYVECGDRNV